MRFFAILAVTAAVLMPVAASADPDQLQTAPTPDAQAAPGPATTQTAQAKPVPTATAAVSNLDEIECRTSPPTTGTRLGATRECHTVREWNKRQQDSQDNLKLTQEHGLMGLAGKPGN